MSKKNILFVCASMMVGGAEKSLINLLNMLDYDEYCVSLLLLKKQGALMDQIPSEVKILDLPPKANALYDKTGFSFIGLAMKVVKYCATGLELIRWSDYDVIRAFRWRDFYKQICEPIYQEFDVVVAFQSGESTYYAFDKVSAKRYVTYFHTDIENIRLAKDIEAKYLNIADLIVTISPKCVESIALAFPKYKDKIIYLENPSSEKLIRRLAGNEIPKEYLGDKNKLQIVSVGRLVDIKGYDLVVDAAEILKNDGVQFNWTIVGEGSERRKLEHRIVHNHVEDCVQLIGQRLNPYPYIKFANLLVQSSRYEGKSMVLDEAKILGKQILVTNYNSAKDQIIDSVDGYICDISAEGIADGVKKSINHPLKVQNIKGQESIVEYMRVLLGEM